MANVFKKTTLTRTEMQRRYWERKKAENPDHYYAKERLRWVNRKTNKKVSHSRLRLT